MNIPKNLWSTLVGAAALLIVFLAVLSIKTLKEIGYVGHNPTTVNTISVDGTGDATSVPDVATFSFSVTETAKTVADAQTQATKKINAALGALKTAGIADKDISTQSYNINPHYEYQNAICPSAVPVSYSGGVATTIYCPSGKSVLTGYDVSQNIQVKVRDLTKAGAIFTSIGSLGVQNVDSLSFSVDKPEVVQAEARAKAIDAAKSKAGALAKQLGVSLGKVVSFSENSGGYVRPMMYSLDAKAMSTGSVESAPSIPTGEQKTTSNVSITYEIQ